MQLNKSMKKTAWLLNTFLILFLLTASSVKAAVAGPHLLLSPSSGDYSVNGTFSVTVKVDSASEVIGAIDGIGTYDSSRLELVSAVEASPMVFESINGGGSCSVDSSTVGRFNFTCYSNDSLSDQSINGNLVTLNFKAKATGTAVVEFTCASGETKDSNIIKTSNASDVIVCGENVNGSYVIGNSSSGGDTTTAAPTSSSSSSTTTSTELPKTGGVETTLGLVIFGAISLASAVFLKFL